MKPLLKYCGNQSFEDIVVTANSQAQYLGFVFAPSKRCVDPLEVQEWLLEQSVTQKLVGVFVNSTLQEMERVLNYVPLDVIQCHGDEPPDFVARIKEYFQINVWKVIHHSESGVKKMKSYRHLVDGFVIDSKVEGQRGGTGMPFEWEAIPLYQEEASLQNVLCFIAGGINVNSVRDLLQYKPLGVDLSSGIEVNGMKSEKVKNQFEARLFL
ncbi:phosphoribosylanthranilate isomerase [Anaerobacillus sp. CMMVII]|uniref:phosphoribosylanthranilate isomerase n=1 Tax=Anaerobacillus sp. CMMVII TaxID=2755588 RepID=UPI0021B7245A|nr:phosphoribosylanthranilate isomerase [Anaerobacillus sp. CMMVII]MCT8138899.1 phosphoribosylanthranilate isomerase [Anaerobacillus sp. CMMVII]